MQPHRLARHQHGGYSALQQLRVEFCRAFKRREQSPQALGFVFFVANSVVLLLCQLANQASGSVLVERLGVQNVIEFDLCIRMCRCGCFPWLRDALRLFCQSAKQVRDLLLDFRCRWLGTDTLECFLCEGSLRQALLGLPLFSGCLE